MVKVLCGFDGIKNKEVGFIGLKFQLVSKVFETDRLKINQNLQAV